MDNWRLEEQVFAKVMRNIPFGMVVCREGLKRKVYYVNQAAYTMLGYTRDEYVQMVQNGWHNFIHVDIREIIRENHEAICSGEEFEVITKARKMVRKFISGIGS